MTFIGIGRVIIDGSAHPSGGDTAFFSGDEATMLATPEMAGAALPREHVRFCRQRADKRDHCEDLGLTHFVDDHPEVHSAIRGSVEHQYLFGPARGVPPTYAEHVPTWPETETRIRLSMRCR